MHPRALIALAVTLTFSCTPLIARASQVEDTLGSMEKLADDLHKAAHALDAEANRHAVLEDWNGMFGAGSPAYAFPYQNYSAAAMMPINEGLASDFSQGNLLPPRPEVVNKDFDQFSSQLQQISSQAQTISIPSTAPGELRAQWSILQDQLSSIQKDQTDLAKIVKDQVILQEPFMNSTKKILTESHSIQTVIKEVQKQAKHLK